MITAIQTIAEQLTEIYFKEEFWHTTRMSYEQALNYHQEHLDSGDIVCYIDNGEVLGYYERYIIRDSCKLYNMFIKKDLRCGKVFFSLYRHFFDTMPKNITKIIGDNQKLSGKFVERIITKERRHGND
jgi:hypothetical protein